VAVALAAAAAASSSKQRQQQAAAAHLKMWFCDSLSIPFEKKTERGGGVLQGKRTIKVLVVTLLHSFRWLGL